MPADHFAEAQRNLDTASYIGESERYPADRRVAETQIALAFAQVHATLAVAAALHELAPVPS